MEQWLDGPSSRRLARNLSDRSGGTERQDSGAGGQSGAPDALPPASTLYGSSLKFGPPQLVCLPALWSPKTVTPGSRHFIHRLPAPAPAHFEKDTA